MWWRRCTSPVVGSTRRARRGHGVVRAVHAALGRRLLVLLDGHGNLLEAAPGARMQDCSSGSARRIELRCAATGREARGCPVAKPASISGSCLRRPAAQRPPGPLAGGRAGATPPARRRDWAPAPSALVGRRRHRQGLRGSRRAAAPAAAPGSVRPRPVRAGPAAAAVPARRPRSPRPAAPPRPRRARSAARGRPSAAGSSAAGSAGTAAAPWSLRCRCSQTSASPPATGRSSPVADQLTGARRPRRGQRWRPAAPCRPAASSPCSVAPLAAEAPSRSTARGIVAVLHAGAV